MTPRPRRSALYMPVSNARDRQGAYTPVRRRDHRPGGRGRARGEVGGARPGSGGSAHGGFANREVVIRTNGLDTEWGRDDFAAVAQAGSDAVLVPKVSTAATLMEARSLLGDDGPPL